jgi:hypothetical protein
MKRVVALLSMFLLAGCFEIEQTINLEKDLSGTADFRLGVDLEPMVVVMAQFGREMEGKTGPMTAEELAKAKAEFKKSAKTKKPEGETPSVEEMSKSMPEGVKLLDCSVKENDFGMVSDFRFAFDNLTKLVNVTLPSKGDDPSKKNVIDSPFEGLEVAEEGDRLTIRSKAQNPAAEVEEQAGDAPKLDDATQKLVKDAFSKMRVVYRITAPFEVVSHNATRREGKTLVWEYDMETFEKMAASGKVDDGQLRVTYRK